MNLVLGTLILGSILFGIFNSSDGKKLYIMRDGYRETKSNYFCALHIVDTDSGYIQPFHINDEVVLPNEELLKASWKFQVNYTAGSRDNGLTIGAKYRRVGPLVECEQFRVGSASGSVPRSDRWTNVWDFIIVHPSLLQPNGTNNNGTAGVVRIESKFSESPYYDYEYEHKTENSSGPSCRRVKEDNMAWYNAEKYFDPFLGSNLDRDEILKLQLQFQIQFISRTDNREAIQKYNEAVAEELV